MLEAISYDNPRITTLSRGRHNPSNFFLRQAQGKQETFEELLPFNTFTVHKLRLKNYVAKFKVCK